MLEIFRFSTITNEASRLNETDVCIVSHALGVIAKHSKMFLMEAGPITFVIEAAACDRAMLPTRIATYAASRENPAIAARDNLSFGLVSVGFSDGEFYIRMDAAECVQVIIDTCGPINFGGYFTSAVAAPQIINLLSRKRHPRANSTCACYLCVKN